MIRACFLFVFRREMIEIRCLVSLHFHFMKKTFSTITILRIKIACLSSSNHLQICEPIVVMNKHEIGEWIVTCKIDINFAQSLLVFIIFYFQLQFSLFLLSNFDVNWWLNELRCRLNLWRIELWIWNYVREVTCWTCDRWRVKLRLCVANTER